MNKGWYKESPFKLIVEQAKIWATEMGYEGEKHRTQVQKYVVASLEDY